MENEEFESQADRDWDNRTLCIDESCIGVIGPDGRCKECGKSFESGQQEDIPVAPDFDEEDLATESVEDDESTSPTDIDWDNRTLCIDESCIGVIGPDGCCKECGKPFEGG